MSKKPAAIPLFADAYLADTMHLTTEEHGAYLLLLMAAWRQEDCALPDDDRKLARIAGMTPRKWQAIKPTIMEFWTVADGRISQARLRKEHAFACQKSEQNKQAAEARWEAQRAENKQKGGMRTQSKRNAPPPPPTKEPKGSSARKRASRPDGVSEQTWKDFNDQRKKLFTDTALAGFSKEAAKAGWPLEEAFAYATMRGWEGFNAEWVNDAAKASVPASPAKREPMNPVDWLAHCRRQLSNAEKFRGMAEIEEWRGKVAEAERRLNSNRGGEAKPIGEFLRVVN